MPHCRRDKNIENIPLNWLMMLSVSGLYSIRWQDYLERNWEGSSHGLIKVLSLHLSGGTEENHENLSQNRQCPS
jgi:hypothetical protein